MSDSLREDLKARIAARRAVLVVGSGVTIAATRNAPTAGWTGLLAHGVQRCAELDSSLGEPWCQRALADINSGRLDDLLAGASKVGRALRRNQEWGRWLADTVGALQPLDPEVLDAIGRLDAPIVTTNYDDLLERRLNRHAITPNNREELIAFSRLESRDGVLHVHGHWRHPDTVALDVGDYERVVGDRLLQAGLRTMGEVWSLVFVGCGDGLSDPNFEQFLDWMGEVLRGARHRHFRLERACDVAARQRWHTEKGHRIRVLSYGDEFRDLPGFLAQLEPAAAPSESETAVVRRDTRQFPSRAERPAVSSGEYIRLQATGREAVQKLLELTKQLGFRSVESSAKTLFTTLEQDLYRVAITGRSRAGKSTLVNALIERPICPVERVITTAIPIIIGPGAVEGATISFAAKVREPLHLDGPITSDMLAPYADQRHNPNNEKRVERVHIHLGHRVLDLGVEYADIPGFDDPNGRIWSAANEVIESAHALVLVLDVSPFESGGFALDKGTRELLESARRRNAPVLIVCNKADKLSSSDRKAASEHLIDELARFGLETALKETPFLLSAREAMTASTQAKTAPASMAAFEEALWRHLWNTDSVGLRRLYAVFEGLRVANDEVTALFRVRFAKGPERGLLRDAIKTCRADVERIRSTAAERVRDTRNRAENAAQSARAMYLQALEEHIASLSGDSALPTISSTLRAVSETLTRECTEVLSEVRAALHDNHRRAEKSVSRSLARLRQATGATKESDEARDTLEAVARLIGEVSVPSPADAERTIKVAGAGIGAGAAIGFAVGGPVGWLLGGAVGLLVSAVVDQATDSVATREELRGRTTRLATETFSSFRTALDAAIVSAGEEVDGGVRTRMQPFLDEMEQRLDAIREPTPDELRLHEDLAHTTTAALRLLRQVLSIDALAD